MSDDERPEIWHVYPEFSGERPHLTETRDCWCEPRIEEQDNGAVIVIHERWEDRE